MTDCHSQAEGDTYIERHELVLERINEMIGEETVRMPYRTFFTETAKFILMCEDVYRMKKSGELDNLTLDEWEELNEKLYSGILRDNYIESNANPDYAVKCYGEYGKKLALLYTEIRSMIPYVFEERLADITILEEIFVQIYSLFCEDELNENEITEALYYFISDNCDMVLPERLRETIDPEKDFAKKIIMESDLDDLRYLYKYGEYISDNELELAAYMNSLPEKTIWRMADTWTEGYRKGFEVSGRSFASKKTVQLRFPIGFERMVRAAIENFRDMGLEPVIPRAGVGSLNRTPSRTNGYYSSSPSRQYDYDHRYDHAFYFDKAFRDRKLGVMKVAYEELKEAAKAYAGPAVLEPFGAEGFNPLVHESSWKLSSKQEKLIAEYTNEVMQLQDKYIPGSETSFTIIAFPIPAIGSNFADIFSETIRINTLDYEMYRDIQQIIIQTLDKAECVKVQGAEGNDTELTIAMHTIKDPENETNFENCVADVNIPVGEVFTSPVLKGTNGTLHVGNVFIGDFQFQDLRITIKDGMAVDYTCSNLETEEECRDLVKQVIMKNHDELPMGEFAIGTNTTAYAVAERYDILDKFPILIAEKMGPHFAFGDTCYSYMEEVPMVNPDGKTMKAVENELSALRHTDPAKAYFNCHTDITIPYSELGTIDAVCSDGEIIRIIDEGRFVLPGTEDLNKPLED